MARSLLEGKAVPGIVTAVDGEHREVVTTNRARRRAAGRAIARSFWGDGGQLGGGQHMPVTTRNSAANPTGGTHPTLETETNN